ncbi:MAG: VOC family protein [Deltaproteobacteria bacterium]|nr:VOC family protein [Deltaproteobacteria bacterium]
MRLHHAAVVCRSREHADRFYGGILGLQHIKTATLEPRLAEQIFGIAQECQFMLFGSEQLTVEIFIADIDSQASPLFEHLCLEVTNRDQFAEQCETQGLEVKRIPRGDTQLIFVKDYDGNLFEIKELE